MTYVYVLPMREPFSVASQVATLACLSGGRFRFGVGAGWLTEEIAMLGHAVRGRGRRMDEMLEIIRRFWTEDDVEFHGEFFDFEPAGITPKPPEPVPVWIGGKSPAALARAARHEGWLGMNYDLPEVYELLAALKILQRGDLRLNDMIGAYAGEIGQTQFLPSSYIKYGVDFDGDGHVDLRHSVPDVLASTANLLHSNGFKMGAPYGEGSANFEAMREWNRAVIYRKTIGYFADQLIGR